MLRRPAHSTKIPVQYPAATIYSQLDVPSGALQDFAQPDNRITTTTVGSQRQRQRERERDRESESQSESEGGRERERETDSSPTMLKRTAVMTDCSDSILTDAINDFARSAI